MNQTPTTDDQRPMMKTYPLASRKARYCFGIDPDLIKNGVAIWDTSLRRIIDSRTLTFARTLQHIQSYPKDEVLVYVEAGWLNKTKNFHAVHLPDRLRKADPSAQVRYVSAVRERIAHDVGQNAAAGKLLIEMLTELGYAVVTIQPTARKWKPEDYKKFTGLDCKNQERIDAARLVVGL
ncbi:hypothetical protein GGR92_000015 [Spirosoma lacussanchae]|uniref:hypothetical protein n=1 Tax=Spirosoma lacussanchae TaxID=1884249 RepID=UPI0011091F29|nr:hypothetical protein [Spirosoma lacussanchae]